VQKEHLGITPLLIGVGTAFGLGERAIVEKIANKMATVHGGINGLQGLGTA
jgi:hypothetical protein